MRFITEFKLDEDDDSSPLDQEISYNKHIGCIEIGESISKSFGWPPVNGNYLHYKLEIEAFPMDKWVEFKQKLHDYLHVTGWVSGAIIFKMIEELESFGKPSGDAITNLADQMEYRGPSSHCKACEDEKAGIKHIQAQNHTCKK